MRAKRFANHLDVDFVSQRVHVAVEEGASQEAAARDARYAALRQHVGSGDWLLTAHHLNDQAETLLINLMRGSGPAGLKAMQPLRDFHGAVLARPLLQVPRGELLDYARRAKLDWIEDPSNQDQRFDRNFLRHSVLPLLATHWNDPVASIAKSAALARDSNALLDELADIDLAQIESMPGRLSLKGLRDLSHARAANALRRACDRAGLARPPAARLECILRDLIGARADAEPVVRWRGSEARRFDQQLYLLQELAAADFDGSRLCLGEVLSLGPGLGHLELARTAGAGLRPELVSAGLEVRTRHGGEEIKPLGQQHTRKLKKLLQENSIPPWVRRRLPLLYSGGQLVAVADLWIDENAASQNGYSVQWRAAPPH
jgi:tRNA(Ile)-lysidine synthase